MSGHARLSASSAHRWLHCPPSANYSGGKASQFAAAGTFAHDIAAKCLNDASLSASDFFLQKATIDGFEVECDLEMVDAVNLYLDEIAADLQPGDDRWVEMPLLHPLARIDPDLGGTADYVRYRPEAKHLLVTDFKFGSGVYVDVEDNAQLKLYALGAMLACERAVKDVTVRIVQPRFEGAKPVRDFHFKAHDILDFVADVRDAAVKSRDPKAEYKAGEHCKFCPHAKDCPELERQQHALLADDFAVVHAAETPLAQYDPVKLSAALKAIPLVKERIKALEEFAYQEASAGKEIPDFKLVDKRAVRRWKSEGDVIEWAEKQAIDPYAPREILSPAQLEKKVAETAPKGKKKEAGKMLEPFVEKVSSGTALVPVTDERPPAKQLTANDFEVLR